MDHIRPIHRLLLQHGAKFGPFLPLGAHAGRDPSALGWLRLLLEWYPATEDIYEPFVSQLDSNFAEELSLSDRWLVGILYKITREFRFRPQEHFFLEKTISPEKLPIGLDLCTIVE